MNSEEIMFIAVIATIWLLVGGVIVGTSIAFGEERECKDRISDREWESEGHDDNTESEKAFFKSLKEDSFCETVEKHDKEELKGTIREDSKFDFDDFKETKNWDTATPEQKMCLMEDYETPDSGKENLAGYEHEYCGWDYEEED